MSPLNKSVFSSKGSLYDLDSPTIRGSDVKRYFCIAVTIVQARGLQPHDRSGFSDPYCVITVGRKSKKTKPQKRTLSPLWHETMLFNCNQLPREFTIDIFDWNRFSQHSFMGQVVITMPACTPSGEWPAIGGTFPLAQRPQNSNSLPPTKITGEIELQIEISAIERSSTTEAAPSDEFRALNVAMPSIQPAETSTDPPEHVDVPRRVSSPSHGRRSSEPPEPVIASPTSTSVGSEVFQSSQQLVTAPSAVLTPVESRGSLSSVNANTRVMVQERVAASKEMAKQVASNLSNRLHGYFQKHQSSSGHRREGSA